MAMTAISSGLRCASAVELSNNAAAARGSRAVAVRAVGSNPSIKSPYGVNSSEKVGRGTSGHSPLSKWVYCYACQAPKVTGGDQLLPSRLRVQESARTLEKNVPRGLRKRLPNEVYHSLPLWALGYALQCDCPGAAGD